MVVRLSELLERIRPAGTPGPAAEGGELQRRAHLDDELADIARLLAGFEREADHIRETAHEEADGLRRNAEHRARQIRSGLPDRIAVARAQASESLDRARHTEQDEIAQQTERTLGRLRQNADERRAALVHEILDAIWSSIADDLDAPQDAPHRRSPVAAHPTGPGESR